MENKQSVVLQILNEELKKIKTYIECEYYKKQQAEIEDFNLSHQKRLDRIESLQVAIEYQ